MSLWLEIFLRVVFPVFLIAGAGYLYAGRRPVDVVMFTDIIIYLMAPCLILHGLLEMDRLDLSLIAVPLSSAGVLLVLGAMAWPTVRWMERRAGRSLRGLYLPILFQNSGNMGIPMAALAFGDARRQTALLYFSAISFFHYSIGVGLARGRDGGFYEFLRLPLFHVLVLGMAIRGLGWEVPDPVRIPLGMLGQASLPLMIFTLGCQLRAARIAALGPALAASVLRLGGGYAAALLVSRLMGLDGLMRNVFLLSAVMPAAVMNYALAEKYGQNAEAVGSAILLSTLLSIPVIPMVLSTL